MKRAYFNAVNAITIFTLAFLVRVTTLLILDQQGFNLLELGGGDGGHYLELARYLAEGRIDNTYFLVRPPLFPSLLALLFELVTFKQELCMCLLNALFSSLSVLITFHLGQRVGLTQKTAVAAACFLALDPFSIYFGISPLSEASFGVLICLLYLLILQVLSGQSKTSWLTWSNIALLAVCATITRPIALYYCIPLALLLLFRRKVLPAILICLLSLGTASLWKAQNNKTFNNPTFSSVSSFNALFLKSTAILRRVDGRPAAQIELDLAQKLDQRLAVSRAYSSAEEALRFNFVPDSAAREKMMRQMALEIFKAHPFWYIANSIWGVLRVLLVPFGYSLWTLLLLPLYTTFYIYVWKGLLKFYKEKQINFFLLCALSTLYFCGLPVLIVGAPYMRFIYPVLPLLSICAALGYYGLQKKEHL